MNGESSLVVLQRRDELADKSAHFSSIPLYHSFLGLVDEFGQAHYNSSETSQFVARCAEAINQALPRKMRHDTTPVAFDLNDAARYLDLKRGVADLIPLIEAGAIAQMDIFREMEKEGLKPDPSLKKERSIHPIALLIHKTLMRLISETPESEQPRLLERIAAGDLEVLKSDQSDKGVYRVWEKFLEEERAILSGL